MLAVNERATGEKGSKKLRKIAEAVVEAAMSGDMTAAKEVGDRLDGRPVTPLAGTEDSPFKLIIDWARDRAG